MDILILVTIASVTFNLVAIFLLAHRDEKKKLLFTRALDRLTNKDCKLSIQALLLSDDFLNYKISCGEFEDSLKMSFENLSLVAYPTVTLSGEMTREQIRFALQEAYGKRKAQPTLRYKGGYGGGCGN